METVLLVDFGSTYTKISAVDLDEEEIIATAQSPTTVETDIREGYNRGLDLIEDKLRGVPHNFVDKLACSSAAGGLKMVAVGLVPELTAEAAKRAALGAGARILATYSFELDNYEIQQIKDMHPDIIILSGGTDGGDKHCILHNAKIIAENINNIPVIVAGNKKARNEIEHILKKHNVYYHISENVMPKINVLNVEPVRKNIEQMFIEKIVEAKGIKKMERFIGSVIMPTPAAVLKSAQVLADGVDGEPGIGELIVIDIGGATTDIHSISRHEALKPGVILQGLDEPYAKRTVEGDLGVRVSAVSLLEAVGVKQIKKYLTFSWENIESRCRELSQDVSRLSKTAREKDFDKALACVAVEKAIERHAGKIKIHYTPTGNMFVQTGKNLRRVKKIIGTGGVIVNSENPNRILSAALGEEGSFTYLKPFCAEMFVDRNYILAAMGLLAEKHPKKALRILKKYLKRV